jgi:hypothetical protein
MARRIVANALPRARVVRHDDNSADGMVDAIITYPEGHAAALEVVRDTDPGYQRIRARLRNAGEIIAAPELNYTWYVIVAGSPVSPPGPGPTEQSTRPPQGSHAPLGRRIFHRRLNAALAANRRMVLVYRIPADGRIDLPVSD